MGASSICFILSSTPRQSVSMLSLMYVGSDVGSDVRSEIFDSRSDM